MDTTKAWRYSGFVTIGLLMCACASPQGRVATPTIASADLVAALRQEGVQPPKGEASEFKERTKGKVAAASTLLAAAALLGGGARFSVGARNKEPANGYTVTQGRDTVFGEGELATYADVSEATAEALRRKLVGGGIALADQSSYGVSAIGNFWGIDYDKMSGKDNYRLYYDIKISLNRNSVHLRSYACVSSPTRQTSWK